jgi:hypothetical protein
VGDDLLNTVWGSGSKICINTLIDTYSDRNKSITLYYLDDNSVFQTETLQTDLYDSSKPVTSNGFCSVLLGYSASGISGTLRITNIAGAVCKSIVAPTTSRLYGYIACNLTTGAHRIKITCNSGSVTGTVVIKWLDSLGTTTYETVNFVNSSYMFSQSALNTLVGIYTGADSYATASWTVTVEANTIGQKVGTTVGACLAKQITLINSTLVSIDTQIVEMDTGGQILQGYHKKLLIVNSSGDQTLYLPQGIVGLLGAEFSIVKVGTGKVTIVTSGTDIVGDSSAGGTIYSVGRGMTKIIITLVATGKFHIFADSIWITT